MMTKITLAHLKRHAIIYIRQSSLAQVIGNLESQRRQYDLVNKAKAYGFSHIDVIDEDLGRSGSGVKERPGFSKMVALVCEGNIGAIFCIEASRLARNGRDWHHLIDLCSLVKTLIIDPDGIYDPLVTNDRLLLGMKGTMSEFELTLLKQRAYEALKQKAMRGELKFCLPIGFCWSHSNKIQLEPHQRVQEAIHLVFRKFLELRSARQVLLWFREENISLPKNHQDAFGKKILWDLPIYKNILSILHNPLYAGAYAFGKTEERIKIVQGRARKTRGHRKPQDQWLVLLKDHHQGYISWDHYEENQKLLLENTHMYQQEIPKSGRGGRALLAGLLRCGHCSRMLHVTYSGTSGNVPRYHCRGAHINHGGAWCISFGGLRPDEAISDEILKVVQTDAIEASFKAAEQMDQQQEAHHKVLALELEQARYEVNLCARRYEVVDPTNRLVAAQLETQWNQALEHLQGIERRVEKIKKVSQDPSFPSRESLFKLATHLKTVWNASSTTPHLKQKILRLLIVEIVVFLDKENHQILLTIHWKGGRHSHLQVPKNKTGHHRRCTGLEALAVITSMAPSFSDKTIATTLNRLGLKTGTENSWTQGRVSSTRNYHTIPSYKEGKDTSWLTLEQAAKELQINETTVRRLIKKGLIKAKQVVKCAPWQINKAELIQDSIKEIVNKIKQRNKRMKENHQNPSLLLVSDKNSIISTIS